MMSANVYETTGHQEDSIFQTSSKGFSDATTDARAAAKVAAQNVKDGVGWSVYKAAFGVSFGVVFTGVFLTELLPARNVLRRGLEDGTEAALEAIEARKIPADPDADYEHDIAEPLSASSKARPAASRKPLADSVDLKPGKRKTSLAR